MKLRSIKVRYVRALKLNLFIKITLRELGLQLILSAK